MANCKGKLSKEFSKNQMRGEAYRPSKPDTRGKETINVVDTPVNENSKVEDAVVTNAKIPFVNPETPTKSESVMQGPNTSLSDTNGLKANDSMGKLDKKQHESDAILQKPVQQTSKDVLSSANIKNNSGEETNLKEAPPTGISLNKEPDYKSDDEEIEKPGYLFSKGVLGEEAQTEDLGFTNKITGIKDPLPTDQSSSARETVPTEKAKDEDKKLTIVDGNVLTKTASGNVSELTVENKSNQSYEHKDDSTEKPSDKLQPGNTPSENLQPGSTPSDKLQPGNTPSDKLSWLLPGSTPSDKLQPGSTPSDNQQNKNDSTGYNHPKFSNPFDEQDKKMSKEMKEIDGKKKKKKPDKYDPPAIIQNYYGYVETVNLGNDFGNIVEKVKEVEKVPIVETFQPSSTISADEMKVLLKVSQSVGIFYGRGGTGTCWRVGKDTVMTAAHVVKDNIWSTFNQFLNEEKYKECYVDFNYNGQTKKDTDSKYVFDLERTAYFDETLDVAVVKLKRETHKEFPPPLQFFEVLDPEQNDDEHIYLIGHDKGNKLHINYGIGLWNPTEKRLTDLIKFCQEYGKENGYKELDRKDRLVIQCKFVSGASGCPGVIIRGDKASVVLIYIRGYPDFYFSKNFPEKDRQAFPDERLLQQGVNIGPVFESMTKKKMHLNLRNEIFPHQASEEQQQLNGQHQYAIDGAKKSNPESTFENVKNLEDHIIVRHVQDIENNTAKWTTCTEGHSETAIPDSAKYNRQPFYALAIDDRVDIAYPNMKPPADDTDITLSHGHSQNIPVHRNEQNITQDDNAPVHLSSGGAPPGQGPSPYPLSLIGQYSSNFPHAVKGEDDLENFNVRVFYDKLEDQNLHMASQLARQQEDLSQFYKKICEQNDELKKLLQSLDPAKLDELQKRMEDRERQRDGLQGASGPTSVNANLNMGAAGKLKFAGGSNREGELMSALQLLLERLNTGNIPVNQSVIDQLQKGGDIKHPDTYTTNITNLPSGTGGKQGDLLRKQNNEKMQLEKELNREEREAMERFIQTEEGKKLEKMGPMTTELAGKLQGDLNDAKVKDIMSNYEKNFESNMSKFESEKDRQAAELRRKLAEKRKRREAQLREKHNREAEDNGLPPLPEGEGDNHADVKIRMTQSTFDTLQAENTAGTAKGEMDMEHNLSDEERKQMSEKLKDHLDRLQQQGIITDKQKTEVLQKHMEHEMNLDKLHKQRREQQLAHMREKMAERKKKKLRKLQNQHDAEMIELSSKMIESGNTDDLERELEYLKKLHQQEMEAAEADMNAEENEHLKTISKSIDDEHTGALKQKHRDVLKNLVDNCPEVQKVTMQRLMDDYRKDMEVLNQDLSLERNRQLSETDAKLAARRARRLQENQRRTDENEAQRLMAEQNKQLRSGGVSSTDVTPDSDLSHVPEVKYVESAEGKALKNQHERTREELRKQHKHNRDQMAEKLDNEAQKQEQELRREHESEKEKQLREKRNRQAAEMASRKDLSDDQLKALMASHEQELDDLAERLESDRDRQYLNLRDKLAKKRKQKMEELRRKQDVDLTKEMIEQKKEMDGIRMKQAKGAEKQAIAEGIKQNGEEDSDKVIKAVLANRQAQELSDLDKEFAAKKKIMVDDALSKLHDKYDKLRDQTLKRHQEELAALNKKGLSPEELQHQRNQLLNQHQLELSSLDKKLSSEEQDIEKGALADWEVEYAKAKLNLKEKHYKEFAAALKEFSPGHDGVKEAENNAEELASLKHDLEKKRKEEEAKLKKEQDDFEKNEKKRLDAELKAYEKQLEQETQKEKEKHDKNIDSLNKRKEDLIKERKLKMKEELDKLKQSGASEDDQKRLIEQYEKDLQGILNKMEADKIRMQSNLQERLKKKREERMRSKKVEMKENSEDQKHEMDMRQKAESNRLKNEEAIALQQKINSGYVPMPTRPSPQGQAAEDTTKTTGPSSSGQPDLPQSYSMAAPLNEAELMALLMASPMYQKLEDIKKSMANGAHTQPSGKHPMEPGKGFQEDKDTEWGSDDVLQPVDLNQLNARTFVVYKFGSFVADLVASRCRHVPVTILLANKIPPNSELARNQYRNSFHFDANNRILYVRTARLDTVGDFIVVLVHTMAHIKAGDLRDDSNPDFLREYHRALAVVCDDLFFARYRQSSGISKTLAKKNPGVSVEHAALQLLQAMFGDCRTEDEKMKVVEDLLDVKLLPGTDTEGVHFNKERMQQRLAKFSSFSASSKLVSMLGEEEDKLKQSTSQGVAPLVDASLGELSHKYSTTDTASSVPQPPMNFVTANMTGHALWQTFVNRQDPDQEPEQPVQPTDTQESLQDAYDNLCEDFTTINKELVELQDSSKALEEMSAGSDGKSGKQQSSDTAEKMATYKERISKLEIQKKQTAEKIDECLKKMEQKTVSTIEPERYEDKIPKSGKKSKK